MGRTGLMGTELDELQGLLEHVLPDPAGYAQRVALQFMTLWGQSARPDGTTYAPADGQNVTLGDVVGTPDRQGPDEPPLDIDLLLAAALGACECWGLQADCESCRGHGSSGWTAPDPELFDEFVRPAIARLSEASANGRQPANVADADEDTQQHQTAQGVRP